MIGMNLYQNYLLGLGGIPSLYSYPYVSPYAYSAVNTNSFSAVLEKVLEQIEENEGVSVPKDSVITLNQSKDKVTEEKRYLTPSEQRKYLRMYERQKFENSVFNKIS